MLKMLQSYRALVEALIEAQELKNKAYENAIAKSMQTLKPEIYKFLKWANDKLLKNFIELFYFNACTPAKYEAEVSTSYDSMRACCRRQCEKYDTINSKKI